MEPIVNRVAESDIDVFNLESLWDGRPVLSVDIAPFLDEGILLREKPFRDAVRTHDWTPYAGAHVAVFCSTDAIVPTWAFMLIGSRLEGVAHSVAIGTADELRRDYFVRALEAFDWSVYTDRIVVVKGCASRLVPANAYAVATQQLQRVARKLMYGEPCSSVPLWRRPAATVGS
ncbi:MAG: DUF2480 family protein [Rhodothermales bacterium]|nr:DUF2480 family protein [Rhodothermales bacterium]